ncbi:hypothetical protein EJB05_03734, partial [Eragrostis curvula]
ASLADSFLADLDELSDNEAYPEEENAEAAGMEEDGEDVMPDLESLNYDDLDSVSKLQKTRRNLNIHKVEYALQKGTDFSNQGFILEEDPEYQLIVYCNALSVDIENEIIIIHNFDTLKFPELESLVHHPIDYARVVKKIGNEMDITLVDLEGLLPSAMIMVVSVTASTTTGKPLSEENLEKTIEACDRALTLDAAKKKVLDFVESRMGYIAPNLSAIVGSAVASKLMGTAGGLGALAKLPACNVQLLGAKRKTLAGFSIATSQFRVGYLEQTEVFQSTPPALRTRACRLIAAKSTLAARIDSIREPPPAKLPKPLPVPDSEPKKKRGGSRLRKMKERYAQTDMMKLANRMQFGIPEESSLGQSGKASLFAPAQFKATHSNRMSLYYKNMVWINKPGPGLLGHVKSRLIPYCLVIRRSFSDSSKNPSKPEDTLISCGLMLLPAFIEKIGGGFVSVVWLGFGYILSVLCGMISDSEAKVEGKKSENSEIAEAVQQGLRNAREIQIYELWSALTALKMDVDAFKVLILPLIIKGSPKK